MEAAYKIRPYKAEDIPFIQSSWGSSYYKGVHYRYLIGPEEFHQFHRPIRERFFLRRGSTVMVCCASENEDLIMAWLAIERPQFTELLILHYLYVKEAFKGEKLATALLNSLTHKGEIFFTHSTERLEKIMNRNFEKYSKHVYAPHLT